MHDDPPQTPYMQALQSAGESLQAAIERLMEKYQAQPVGNGYIDLIINGSDAPKLITELATLPVAVVHLTWWCLCTPDSKLQLGCPHGMGGPTNRSGPGWFSECVHYPDFIVDEHGVLLDDLTPSPAALTQQCAQLVINYLQHTLPNEPFYSPCLYPGLWLHVPEHWQRKYY